MDDGRTVAVGEEDPHHHLQDHEHTKSTTVYRTRRPDLHTPVLSTTKGPTSKQAENAQRHPTRPSRSLLLPIRIRPPWLQASTLTNNTTSIPSDRIEYHHEHAVYDPPETYAVDPRPSLLKTSKKVFNSFYNILQALLTTNTPTGISDSLHVR